jgi:hypothetical protein
MPSAGFDTNLWFDPYKRKKSYFDSSPPLFSKRGAGDELGEFYVLYKDSF